MSRVIKFRGQTRRNRERIINMAGDKCEENWVYGGIFPQNNGGDFAIIYQQEPTIEKFSVYADTVGQYIGVPDKNGKEIYEGDIVRIIEDFEEIYAVEWDEDIARYVLIQNGATMCDFGDVYGDDMEVIGNVYENADLLKEVDG